MRIIIETNEQERMTTVINEAKSAQQTQAGAISGGPPPEALTQAITDTQQTTAAESAGLNAGPPPEWLMEAVKRATPPGRETSGTYTDAGAAANPGQMPLNFLLG